MIGKDLAYWEESDRSEGLANKCDLSQKWGSGVVVAVQPKKVFTFYLSLEIRLPALKLL